MDNKNRSRWKQTCDFFCGADLESLKWYKAPPTETSTHCPGKAAPPSNSPFGCSSKTPFVVRPSMPLSVSHLVAFSCQTKRTSISPKNNCGVFNCYSLRLEKCCETNRIQQRRHKLWQVDCLFRLEDDKRSDWWCSVPLCQPPWLDHHCLSRKTSDSPTTCLNSPAQYRQPQSRWVPLKICQSEKFKQHKNFLKINLERR